MASYYTILVSRDIERDIGLRNERRNATRTAIPGTQNPNVIILQNQNVHYIAQTRKLKSLNKFTNSR